MKSTVHPMVWVGAGFVVGGAIGLVVGAALCYFLISVSYQPSGARLTPPNPAVAPAAPPAVPPPLRAEVEEQPSDIGRSFDSLREVFAYFDTKGFIMLGQFQNSRWPATIVSINEGTNEIRVVRRDGGAHRYPNYTGYRLKGVSLEDANGNETLLVLRSKEKVE